MTSRHGLDEAIWIERLNDADPTWRLHYEDVYEACADLLDEFVTPPEPAVEDLDVDLCEYGTFDGDADWEEYWNE